MAGVDQRAYTRHDVEHELDITRGDTSVTGRMLNLSRGGTLVSTTMAPALVVGERVQVSFRVPDLEAPITCQAEVRWVNDVDRSMVGLQFVTGLRARETWALGRFLERVNAGDEP